MRPANSPIAAITGRSTRRAALPCPPHHAHGLVADPLQVAVDLEPPRGEAQIDGHRLLLGKQLVPISSSSRLRGRSAFHLLHILCKGPSSAADAYTADVQPTLRERSIGRSLSLSRRLQLKVNARHSGSPDPDCASLMLTVVQIRDRITFVSPSEARPIGLEPHRCS